MVKFFNSIFIVLLSFILFTNVNSINAYDQKQKVVETSFSISADKKVIEVPLGSKIENYKTVKAVGKINEREITHRDYKIYYVTFGNSIKNVNTNRVGEYKVDIKIVLTNYKELSIPATILYKVFDPDLTSQVILDNYNVEINTIINPTALFNLNTEVTISSPKTFSTKKVGKFPVVIEYFDKYNNLVTANTFITVVDNVAPIIRQKKIFRVGIQEPFKIKDFFEVVDNVDENLDNLIDIVEFDRSKVGRVPIKLKVSDYSSNEVTAQFIAIVYDDIAPTIDFKTDNIVLDLNSEITKETFKQYISNISDNFDTLTFDNVVVDYSKLKKEVGTFVVTFIVSDFEGNFSTYKRNISVKSNVGPVIKVKNIPIQIGSVLTNSMILKNIEIEDNEDQVISKSLTIDASNVNTNKAGVYEVIIKAYNSSGIQSSVTLQVNVFENTSTIKKYIRFWPFLLLGLIPVQFIIFKVYKKSIVKKIQE